MREYIRHPTDIPIEVSSDTAAIATHERMHNLSHGGLQLSSSAPWLSDTIIEMRIPSVTPVFQARGKVVWCHAGAQGYDIGVAFLDRGTQLQLSMIEQICQIGHHKRKVTREKGGN